MQYQEVCQVSSFVLLLTLKGHNTVFLLLLFSTLPFSGIAPCVGTTWIGSGSDATHLPCPALRL